MKKLAWVGAALVAVVVLGGLAWWILPHGETTGRPGPQRPSAPGAEQAAAQPPVTPRPWPGAERLVYMVSVRERKDDEDSSPSASEQQPHGTIQVTLRSDRVEDLLQYLRTDSDRYARALRPSAAEDGKVARVRRQMMSRRKRALVTEEIPTADLPAWARGPDLEAAPDLVRLFLEIASRAVQAPADQTPLLELSFHTTDEGETLSLGFGYAYRPPDPDRGRMTRRSLDLRDPAWAKRIGCKLEEWQTDSRLERLQRIVGTLGIQGLIDNAEDAPLVDDFPVDVPAPAAWEDTIRRSKRKLLGTRTVAFGEALVPCWEIAGLILPQRDRPSDPVPVRRYFVAPGVGRVLYQEASMPPSEAQELWDRRDLPYDRLMGAERAHLRCLRCLCVPADKALWCAGGEPDAASKAWKLGPPEQDPALVR